MKKTIIFVTMLGFIIVLSGCGGHTSSGDHDVHVIFTAGCYRDITGKEIPCYWKDTSRTDLGNNGCANSIFVYGDKVYTAGYYSKKIPCYWVNTDRIDLGDNGCVNSLFISGGKVYTAGYYNDGSKNIPCYWVNTKKTDLDSNGQGGSVDSIYVSGNTVYTAGYYSNNTRCYWTNNIRTDLGVLSENYLVKTFYASNNTVYVVGVYNSTPGGPPCYIPFYNEWSNKVTLPGGSKYTSINSIYIANYDVYTVGRDNGMPCYWMNTNLTYLSTESGEGKSITIFNNLVYTAGHTNGMPCYWIGASRFDLPIEKNMTGEVLSIFVQ